MSAFIRIYRLKRNHGWTVLNSLRAARDAAASNSIVVSAATTLGDFISIYRTYRRFHGVRYAIRRAWHIAVQGSPF